MNEHARAVELLTWKVNGRLAGAEVDWLEAHLEGCSDCRRELAAQRAIRDAIAREPTVEFAPQASFNRLWARIEQDSREALPPALAPTVAARRGRRRHWAAGRWTRAALAAQAVLIALLGGALWRGAPESRAPDYRTVTDEAPGVPAGQPVIKAIFDDRVRLGDVQDILAGAGLAVASGPSAAGVYTLVAVDGKAAPLTPSTIARLRADPRVRFAEAGAR
ncbi:MAG TPA: zf-HC2 domain-containing protein [Steroidobacteraceae bacterium]|nr:zf-HC2 domain-containing protein [Steroidobacteraceae bacterium]